jgi:iron complex outermembrane receptor protein
MQVYAASAVVAGLVSGPDGARLPGARIMIREVGTEKTQMVVTGNYGGYRMDLPPGTYSLRSSAEGFEPSELKEVRLMAGETATVDFELAIATLSEIVTVIGPSPRDSLEAAEARESSARDVGEALAHTCGVSKVRKGGIANDVVLRGFQGKDLNVLIDGNRVYGACPNHMDPAPFHVDFSEVDRIEIGKGPFDIRNHGSLGGVVNIITRQPETGFHAGGTLSIGSYGFVNPAATASYASSRFSVLGGYSYRVSEPYSDGSGRPFTAAANYRPGMRDSDAFRAGTAWVKLSAAPFRNHLAQFSYTRQEADHVLYPYLQMDAIYDDTDRVGFGYQVERPSGVIQAIKLQTYYSQVRHWMTDDYRLSSMNFPRSYMMGTFADTRALGGKLETSIHGLNLGLEAFSRDWSAATQMAGMGYQTQYSIPDVETSSVGAYADYHRSLTDRLRLDIGGRIDRAESTADESRANTNLYFAYNSTRLTSATDVYPSGNARITYAAGKGFKFAGGIGHTVRVPDARERYFALRRAGSDWVGNPLLEPSRNTGLDGSASFRHGGLFVTSGFFINRVDDFVTVRRATKANPISGVMNSNSRSYANVDARIYGSELELGYTITRRVFLSSGLFYIRGTQNPNPALGINSLSLAEMPAMTSRTSLRYDTGRFWAEIEGVATGPQRRVDTDLREEPTPGYGLMNLRLGVNFRQFALGLGLNNLFDRSYFEHLSYQRDPFRTGTRVFEPGRNIFASLSYRF